MKLNIIKQNDSIYEYRGLMFECQRKYWDAWCKENDLRMYYNMRSGENTKKTFDTVECQELGIISVEHVIEFLAFINTILPDKTLTTQRQ